MLVANESHTLDPRAARMLEMYTRQQFASGRARRRLALALWNVRTRIQRNLKRLFDIVVASLALIPLFPFMVLVALVVKLDSPGPVLFRQVRVGKWGHTFVCYKFRSMYVDAERRLEALRALNEADGPVFKMKNDPRVTRVGRIIRKLSIDELPQLFNVLFGDMSIVGPRPALPSEVANYSYEQLRRLNAIPGITGLQQVSGRSNVDFQTWIELDLQYIAEQSFRKDVEIIIKTIPAVLFSRGAY